MTGRSTCSMSTRSEMDTHSSTSAIRAAAEIQPHQQVQGLRSVVFDAIRIRWLVWVSINVVTQRRARLVPGWVTVLGR